jgi:hypothetical protein
MSASSSWKRNSSSTFTKRQYIYERQSLPDAMHVGYCKINLAAKKGAAKTIGDNAKVRAHNKKRADWPEGRNKIST